MYREPCCKMRIGTDTKNLEFNGVNRIEIVQSVKDLGDKATITIPRNYKQLNGKSVLELIKSGDPITIWLGYDNKLEVEFSGYVQYIESGAPLVIHADDAFYHWKRNRWNKAWRSVSLEDLLKYIFPGLKVTCPGVDFGAYSIANKSSYAVLEDIKQRISFNTYLKNDEITCRWPYEMGTAVIHHYTMYTPTVKTNNLKYSRSEDKKIRVRVTSSQRTGKKLSYETGAKEHESAAIYDANFNTGMSMEAIKQYAESWYKKLCFDGYSGSIVGFGFPRTNAGDTLKISDPDEPAIESNYLIESVTKIYDLRQGFERINTISLKV